MAAPGPNRLLALARIPLFRRNELAGFRYGWRTGGDLYRVRLGRRDLWSCSHPELVHEVLVTDREEWRRIEEFPPGRPFGLKLALGDGLLTTDGDDWQWHRRIVNPAFHRSRIEATVTGHGERGPPAWWSVWNGQPHRRIRWICWWR